MDDQILSAVSKLLGHASYSQRASDSSRMLEKKILQLLRHKKIPDQPWNNCAIEHLLRKLSAMDCNNYQDNVGVGEREGRVYSTLVYDRHYGLAHGIGRSGDIATVQPKAIGSSVLNLLCNALALHAINLSGVPSCVGCRVFPLATGMAMSLCLSWLRKERPQARYILWSRIDQRTCVKCMTFTGLDVIVVEQTTNQTDGDMLTDLKAIEQQLSLKGDCILCAITTTSCFAPRLPDDITGVAELCKRYDVPHVINNAYGLQSEEICKEIERANRRGRVDFFVQSCDKNFMVPVGGAIVASFCSESMHRLSSFYPGRASATPSIDLLITLLSMGKSGYLAMRRSRAVSAYPNLRQRLSSWAADRDEELLSSDRNPISIAVSLRTLDALSSTKRDVTQLGSMLFSRNVSGAKVVARGCTASIDGIEFDCWGAHRSGSSCSYLTVAASIGLTQEQIGKFLRTLSRAYGELETKLRSPRSISSSPSSSSSVDGG